MAEGEAVHVAEGEAVHVAEGEAVHVAAVERCQVAAAGVGVAGALPAHRPLPMTKNKY